MKHASWFATAGPNIAVYFVIDAHQRGAAHQLDANEYTISND
jgi:hypothetical protein